jgi:hypothetical protein
MKFVNVEVRHAMVSYTSEGKREKRARERGERGFERKRRKRTSDDRA